MTHVTRVVTHAALSALRTHWFYTHWSIPKSCGLRDFCKTRVGVHGSRAQRHVSQKKGRKRVGRSGPEKPMNIFGVSLPVRKQFSKQAAVGTQFPALFVKSDYRRAHVHIRQASGNAPIRNLRCGRCKTLIGSDAVQSLTPRTSLQDRRMLVCGAGSPVSTSDLNGRRICCDRKRVTG